ncbi:MAG TPA: MraY family glycosyltransferase [Planctomycetota bacterium]|nr:MraY family glycosyltransferase [Planctomycetota bacterium]
MGEFVVIYLVAFTLSVFLVPMVRRLALRVGAIDEPDGVRKIHTHAVPRMGGVAIFIAFIVPVLGVYVLGVTGTLPGGVYAKLQENISGFMGLLVASLLVLLLGVYDDIYHVRPRAKVIVQVLAALILCYVGVRIDAIGNPFGEGKIHFPPWLAWGVTVFWVLAITNAINLIDGMDGLGPGVGLFVALTLFVISLFFTVPLVSAVTAALVGAIIGFLIFNFHPAKIFMGDSGSLFVGFLLAAMSAQGSVKRHILIPIIALALPIMDTVMAIIRRWSRGLPMSVPDKLHVHHRLIGMGFSQREAVGVLYAISGILACSALVVAFSENVVAFAVAVLTIVGIFGVGVYLIGGREFISVPSWLAKAWRRRRRRGQAWVDIYHGLAKLENATTLERLWEDMKQLLTELDLDMAHVEVTGPNGVHSELRWTRGDGASGVKDSDGMSEGWTARLPLANDGEVHGRMVLVKDTHRSQLPEAIAEMVDVLRAGLVTALERLMSPETTGASGVLSETPVTGPEGV